MSDIFSDGNSQRRGVSGGCVTIGIPTYNRCDLVLRAVHSVLCQTYTNIEVIVADNASLDDTVDQIKNICDERIVLIKQPSNVGYLRNLNTCLEHAHGELFVLLSDDDVIEPTFVELLSEPLLHGCSNIPASSIGAAWCPCITVDASAKPLWVTQGGPPFEAAVDFMAGLFNGKRGPRFCSVMIRTKDAIAVGGYEARYGALCDTANWGKAVLHYKYAVCVNQPLARYTVHAASHTSGSNWREWAHLGNLLHADLVAVLKSQGDVEGEKRLLQTRKNLLANLVVTVLLRTPRRPGWILDLCREGFQARKFLFTPFVIRRLFRDGWKIFRK